MSVRRLRLVAGLALVLVLLAAVAVVGVRWWQDRDRTDLERAMGYAPPETVRFSWTDWTAVRSELASDLDADSSADEVEAFLNEGYDADLTSGSAMVESAALLQERYGFSPADVDWELLGQSDTGSVLVLGLPDDMDVGDLGDTFESLGYERPDDDTGVWTGGEQLLARIGTGGTISPQFQNLALDADHHLVLASDSAPYLKGAVDDLGDELDDAGLSDVADAVGEPLSAAVYSGAYACKALAMSQADEDDQGAADQLVAATGGVDPLSGFAMAAESDGRVLVTMSFENDDQARRNADSRAELAAGPAIGQGGDFGDRFELGKVTADGRVVTMRLDPVEDSPVLSDLSTGPVLFATC